MNTNDGEALCPFCQGRTSRIVADEASPKLSERLAKWFLFELVLFPAMLLIFTVAWWNLFAGVAVIALIGAVWFRWHATRAIYRCEGCQSVLSYAEVKRAQSTSV